MRWRFSSTHPLPPVLSVPYTHAHPPTTLSPSRVLAAAVGVTAGTGTWRWEAMPSIRDSLQGCVHQVSAHVHGPAQSFVSQVFIRAAIDSRGHQGLQLQTHVSFPGCFILTVRPALAAGMQLLPQSAHLHPKAKVAVLHPCASTRVLHVGRSFWGNGLWRVGWASLIWRMRWWKPCKRREPSISNSSTPTTAETVGGEDGQRAAHSLICHTFRAGSLRLGVEMVMMRQRGGAERARSHMRWRCWGGGILIEVARRCQDETQCSLGEVRVGGGVRDAAPGMGRTTAADLAGAGEVFAEDRRGVVRSLFQLKERQRGECQGWRGAFVQKLTINVKQRVQLWLNRLDLWEKWGQL